MKTLGPLLMVALLTAGCGPSVPDGVAATVAELQGEWLVVNYWAEWCAPCRHEIPELNTLDARAGVNVLGINFDNVQGDALADLGTRMGISFRVAQTDPTGLLGIRRPEVLPTTWVLAPDGAIKGELVGPQTAESIATLIQ